MNPIIRLSLEWTALLCAALVFARWFVRHEDVVARVLRWVLGVKES